MISPWNDLSTNTNWFVSCINKRVRCWWNRFTGKFIGPSSIYTKHNWWIQETSIRRSAYNSPCKRPHSWYQSYCLLMFYRYWVFPMAIIKKLRFSIFRFFEQRNWPPGMQYLVEVIQRTCASNHHVQLVLVSAMVNLFEKPFERLPLLCQYHPMLINVKIVRRKK